MPDAAGVVDWALASFDGFPKLNVGLLLLDPPPSILPEVFADDAPKSELPP